MKPLLLAMGCVALLACAGVSAGPRNPYLQQAPEPRSPATEQRPATKVAQQDSAQPSLVLVGVRGPVALLRGPGGAELFVQHGQQWSYGGKVYEVAVSVGLSETVTLSSEGAVALVVTAHAPPATSPKVSTARPAAAPSKQP